MSNRLITLTGLDRVGKETQSKLLNRALQPSTRFSSPDYDHWTGRLIKAILQEKEFEIGIDGGGLVTRHSQEKHPEIFQGLQSANMVARQGLIKAALETGHVIMDRYEVDALAYGLIDGCDMRYLLELNRLVMPSEYVIILVGTPFPRPGEEPDINERDPVFQQKVRDAYMGYALTHQDTTTVIEVDNYRCEDPYASIRWVHRAICGTLQEKLGIDVTPLDGEQIGEIFPHLMKL
jgi:thymidylate kinase